MPNQYTNEQLESMTYEELQSVSVSEMIEHPPIRNIGIPYTVTYSCKYCSNRLEGSERSVKLSNNPKPVTCPYCGGILWNPSDRNCIRRSAFKPGHFNTERKKRYLKYLKDRKKREL